MESLTSGTLAGTGSFRCEECGYVIDLAAADELPACPGCGGSSFARASLFAAGASSARRAPDDRHDRDELIAEAREPSRGPGEYLAWHDGNEVRLVAARARVDARSGAAWPPTCASTTRPSRAATR